MTIISERTLMNNGRVKKAAPVTIAPEPVEVETPALVTYARLIAVVITAGIAAVSFLLSFATLCDLAHRAGYPSTLAWLWPLAVDGTIVQATIAIIAISANHGSRRFFWSTLVAAASVSVVGNILHALIPHTLPPVLAAVIACVAPLSLLATTHGLAVLARYNPKEEN